MAALEAFADDLAGEAEVRRALGALNIGGVAVEVFVCGWLYRLILRGRWDRCCCAGERVRRGRVNGEGR